MAKRCIYSASRDILAVLLYPGLGNGEPRCNKYLSDLVEFTRDALDPQKLEAKTVDQHIDMLSCLMVVLREQNCRMHIFRGDPAQNCPPYALHRHLSFYLSQAIELGNVQLLYQVGFCLWLLSYSDEICTEMSDTDVVVNMLKVMKGVSKEKVIRVCLACLRNLVDKGTNNQTMIDNNAMKQLAVLRNRKWADDEVKEDLDFIYDALAKSVQVLSSLDMYRKEVKSGKLEWTPVHKSETFWRENVTKMCPAAGSVGGPGSADLVMLIDLLNKKHDKGDLNSEEKTTVAVICHDLGEFARYHPQGKRILQSDGDANDSHRSTKDLLMHIMSNPPGGSEDIGKQALTCIHKMMVTNWQFLESR